MALKSEVDALKEKYDRILVVDDQIKDTTVGIEDINISDRYIPDVIPGQSLNVSFTLRASPEKYLYGTNDSAAAR